jgi:opacity protein-like surface antigen
MTLQLRLFALAALVMVGLSTEVSANPLYLSGSVGADFRATDNTLMPGGPPGSTVEYLYNAGVDFDIAIGVRLPYGFRVEGEGGYMSYTPGFVRPNSSANPAYTGAKFQRTAGENADVLSGTLNVFYDIPLSNSIVPYIGAGYGYSSTSSGQTTFANNGNTYSINGGDSSSAMMLGEVGFSIPVDNNWSIVPAYRYNHFFHDYYGTYDVHVVKIGGRYQF